MKTRNTTWILTIIEVSILTVIGLIINQVSNQSLVEIFAVISVIVVTNRVFNSIDITSLVNDATSSLETPIKSLSSIADINTVGGVDEIKRLLNIYVMIVNPQLKSIKETILQRTIRELERLNYEQRTPVLDEPDFYKWLYSEFENAKSTIHIVSMDEELEWTDTPEEQKFYRINVETAQRGVELVRIFLFDSSRLQEARNNKAIYGHRKGSDTKLVGKVVSKERFTRQAPGTIADAGQGFIVIDGRMVIIDVFSEDGQARGYITFNQADVRKYEALFDKFNAVAMDLEFSE